MTMLVKLPWVLGAILSVSSAQSLGPSNTTTAGEDSIISLSLTQGGGLQPFGSIIPLTDGARSQISSGGISGTLVVAQNPDQAKSILSQDIGYVSCDPSDYPGNINALGVLNQIQGQNAAAIILFTTTALTCNYTAGPAPPANPFIYAMGSKDDSERLLNRTQASNTGFPFSAIINRQDSNSNGTDSNSNQNNTPLGPSPSTAVAMIILYSITGVITALFLVIIITGAVRAHRHPERYGPRNVLGRPRQSRARGLARAMLDTIPIVKFGEKQPGKETELELGTSADTEGTRELPSQGGDASRPSASDPNPSSTVQGTDSVAGQTHDGIAPAEPRSTATAADRASGVEDREGLGCSICTDDFERGQDIRVLPCNHKFHPACIDPWLLNVSGTCPLCRIDLRPTTSHSSNPDDDAASHSESFAPPLAETADGEAAGASGASRRLSILRNVLHLRTAEERAAALRELRENEEVAADRQGSTDNADAIRRRHRLTTRLHDVFRIRTRRRGADPAAENPGTPRGESSSIHETSSSR
ncbi:MAG: hypothetical protein M1820_005635 [Bogoriella megaspora]|nr:MAG: hypothetical protein M1820_005635 [Bogoriella megaspora]